MDLRKTVRALIFVLCAVVLWSGARVFDAIPVAAFGATTQQTAPGPSQAPATQGGAAKSQNAAPKQEYNPFAPTPEESKPANKERKPPPALRKGPFPDPDPKLIAQALDELSFRLIGPANPSGRAWQVLGVPPKDGKGITTTFYVCTAGGGVWKSTDAGTTIVPVFNNQAASSCGAIAVAPSDAQQVWVGTGEPASIRSNSIGGGVFHSANGGSTWEFAGLGDTEEISAIIVDPRDANTVYVAALGHLWGRNAERGIFKTSDGGKSWNKVLFVDDITGFSDLVMDPHNPDTLYAAAWQRIRWGGGDLVESGPGSGIYKTTDAGKTWTKLTQGLPEKCTYAEMLPLGDEDSEEQTSKTPESEMTSEQREEKERQETAEKREEKLERQNTRVDRESIEIREQQFQGGQRAAEATGKVPEGQSCMGKITLAIGQNDSSIIYAAILTGQERPIPEWVSNHNSTQRTSMGGGVFRSDDGGAHWKRVTSSQTNYYYDRITVDPTDDKTVWMPVFDLLRSRNGGETFSGENMANVHNDLHSVWIDPLDPRHMILGGDGGVYSTFDGSQSWMQHVLPVAQFYKVAVDNQEPYWVYGGMQDTGHWAGPSRTYDNEGITNHDWFKLRYNGDGMSISPDPSNPNILYMVQEFGNTSRLDLRTWTRQELQPPPSMAKKFGLHGLRWDWTPPLLIVSPTSPGDGGNNGAAGAEAAAKKESGSTTFLLGANYVFRCTVPLEMPYYPDSWGDKFCQVISPDLTAQQDKEVLGVRDGYHSYGALFSLAQSPVNPRVLWAGADDGPIWVTRDNGAHWQKASSTVSNAAGTGLKAGAMPTDGVVSHIEASKAGPGAAYAVIDRHTRDDLHPYIYFTRDYGASWKSVAGDLPQTGQVYVVLEDPANEKVLFAGTEFGLYVTLDAGTHWVRWNADLPTAPVRTMAIQPRDGEIVVGTFGRGIYVGDIRPLAQMAEAFANDNFLFDAGTAVAFHTRYTYGTSVEQLNGDMFFRARNPRYGMPLYYYLGQPVRAGVRLVVTDPKGALVRSLLGPSTAGFHVFYWDLDWQLQILMERLKYRSIQERVEHPEIQDDEQAFTFSERLARRLVPPGTYNVTMYPNGGTEPNELPAPLAVPRKVHVKNESATIVTGPVRK